MVSCSLEMDPAFYDFNFCSLWDPTLKSGPNRQGLFKLVYGARHRSLPSQTELADTLYCTLRRAAFEAYKQKHGPMAVTYAEWFYSKLRQLFDVLLYQRLLVLDETTPKRYFREIEQPWNKGDGGFLDEGTHLTTDEIEEYLVPEDNERVIWEELVDAVSQTGPANRVPALRRWLMEQRATRQMASKGIRSWGKNKERDQVILSSLARRMGREHICAELDRLGIAVSLPALEAMGFQNWAAAWADPVSRQAIQRLFSKLTPRRNAVKSLIVSE